jgi:putative SOS response-associated peptidase YedK
MCARLFLAVSAEELADFLELSLEDVPALEPRYNIAPTQDVLAVRADASGRRRVAALRWGLVPQAAKDPKVGSRMINARSETAGTRAAFRNLLRTRRCVVPASGFYEWKGMGRVRQPFAIKPRAGLVAVAGLWDTWEGGGGRLETCTLLTTEPNARIAEIHDRMPVLLDREQLSAWLDPERPADDVAALLRPYPADRLVIDPVSTRVNRPDVDEPGNIVPVTVELPEQRTLF